MPMTDRDGRVAVVTGGASGIGLALGRRLKAEGFRLVLADCEQGPLDAAAAELGAVPELLDVRDPDALDQAAERTRARFGSIDLVCANAGVSRMAAIERLTPEDWRWLFEVNVFGVVNTVRSFLPLLKANPQGGHVLITASLSSLYPTRSQGAYGAAKYAIAGYGETLALELEGEGSKVGVSLLCPGPVRTNIGTSARNRGGAYPAAAAATAAEPDVHEQAFRAAVRDEDWYTPDQIAALALEGVRRGDLWIITHSHMTGPVTQRCEALAAAARMAAARPSRG